MTEEFNEAPFLAALARQKAAAVDWWNIADVVEKEWRRRAAEIDDLRRQNGVMAQEIFELGEKLAGPSVHKRGDHPDAPWNKGFKGSVFIKTAEAVPAPEPAPLLDYVWFAEMTETTFGKPTASKKRAQYKPGVLAELELTGIETGVHNYVNQRRALIAALRYGRVFNLKQLVTRIRDTFPKYEGFFGSAYNLSGNLRVEAFGAGWWLANNDPKFGALGKALRDWLETTGDPSLMVWRELEKRPNLSRAELLDLPGIKALSPSTVGNAHGRWLRRNTY